jgi:Domain of Unknown Function (DUF1080)
MKHQLFIFLLLATAPLLHAQITDPVATEQWTPIPKKVNAGVGTAPPSDAIVLFNGANLTEWEKAENSGTAAWNLNKDSSMTVASGKGNIRTKRSFGDCQLHLEFREPAVTNPDAKGQGRGNSGVFFQSRYEVQILDCFDNRTYSNGQTGAIYKQSIPLANVCRKPMEWQTYDIIYSAPQFNTDGIQMKSGYITVIHNGVLIQNHTEIKGTTEYIGLPQVAAHGKAPLMLQDHGDLVSYRNIWIREL